MEAFSTGSKVANTASTTPATPKARVHTSKSYPLRIRFLPFTTISSGNPPPQDPRYSSTPQYGQEGYQQQQQGYGQEGRDPNAPYDPNAPPGEEGERGLMGAIGGGLAGRYAGKQWGGGHSFLGMIGGAIAGSKLEDAAKNKWGGGGSHGGGHHQHHGSHGGGSQHGGSNYGGGGGRW